MCQCKPVKWRYTLIATAIEQQEIAEIIGDYAKDGWELVTTAPCGYEEEVYLIFRKPLVETAAYTVDIKKLGKFLKGKRVAD